MESVIRAAIIYFVLLVIFRITGKRTLAESTPFDIIILLIMGDLVQDAILDDDHSLTNAIIIVITFMVLEIALTFWKHNSKKTEKVLDGMPLIILENGKPLKERMDKSKINEDDILEAAREMQGLERMEQIKYAVLEKDGTITIIPNSGK